MIIHPEVIPTPDRPTIKFREPRESINLDIELPKILTQQGWATGTYFDIQFISHDRSELYSAGQFVVTQDKEGLQTGNPDAYQPMTKMVSTKKAEQIGEWITFVKEEVKTPVAENPEDVQVKWNPGLKVFQVKKGDEVIYQNADKEAAQQFVEAA